MVAPRKEGFENDDRAGVSDRQDRPIGSDQIQESGGIGGSSSSSSSSSSGGSTRRSTAVGLTERLRDVLRDESNGGDLLMDQSEVENGIAQWLRALDLQVLGACRADERLMPLLKVNISTGFAEERLLLQLTQHFEASEVGMLARCLCIPLVSVRVGKVNKQGNLLCPSTTRGHLNLSLLPSSNLQISFVGDDGCTERLAVVSNSIENSEVVIEDITADSSGRSFLLKLPEYQILYFWCSEKSKLHGMQLLAKMKDLLRNKPSLAHLTGICESRLESFATYLRTYLLGSSSNTPEADPLVLSGEQLITFQASDSDINSPSMISKSSRCRFTSSHTAKAQPSHQGSLSPRPNTFKDAASRSASSIRSGFKEKLKRRGDGYNSCLLSFNQPSTPVSNLPSTSTDQGEDDSIKVSNGCSLLLSITQPEMHTIPSSVSRPSPFLLNFPPHSISSSGSLLSPYYCWCPPCPSSLQYSVTPSHLPITFDESMPLPPLSSLLSAAGPPISLVTSSLPIDLPKLPSLGVPSLLPKPFVRLPLPVTSLVTLPTSQQISTFTPFMSDPIVHIPMIGVCSSGQGYLVSAGPAISSTVPPLFVSHSLISNTESAGERSARETLKMLMASTSIPASSACLDSIIVHPETDILGLPGTNQGAIADVSQGFCSGTTTDFEAVVMSLSSMGFSSSKSKVYVCTRDNCDEAEGFDCTENGSEV